MRKNVDIECPRCRFQQPHDEFCANCGINIERYKAKRMPFWKKRALSYYLVLLFVIFFTAKFMIQTFSFMNTNKEQKTNKVISPVSLKKPIDPKEKNTNLTTQALNQNKKEKENTPPKIKKPLTLEQTKASAPPTNKKKEPSTPSATLSIYFAEFPDESLNRLFNFNADEYDFNKKTLTIDARDSSTPLPSPLQFIRDFDGQMLPGKAKKTLFPNDVLQLKFSYSGEELPFTEEPSEELEPIIKLEFSLIKSNTSETREIKIKTETFFEEPLDLDGRFSLIQKEGLIFVIGNLPRRNLTEEENASFSNSFLSIMNSTSFLEEESHLVMVLHFQQSLP